MRPLRREKAKKSAREGRAFAGQAHIKSEAMDGSCGLRGAASLAIAVAGAYVSSSDEGDEKFDGDDQLATYNEYVRASLERYPTLEQQAAALARMLVCEMRKSDGMDEICEEAMCSSEELEARLATATDELDELATDHARVLDEKDALLAENREMSEQVTRLGEDLAIAKRVVLPLRQQLDKAAKRAKLDSETLKRRTAECERMLEDRSRLRSQVLKLHQKLKQAALNRTEMEWQLDRTTKQVATTVSRLGEVERELKAAQRDRHQLVLARERLARRMRSCVTQLGLDGEDTLDELVEVMTSQMEHHKERLLAVSQERDWFAALVRSSRLSESQQVQTLAKMELWTDAMRARLVAIDARADWQLEDWDVLAENAALRRTNAALVERLQCAKADGEGQRERLRAKRETARMCSEESALDS